MKMTISVRGKLPHGAEGRSPGPRLAGSDAPPRRVEDRDAWVAVALATGAAFPADRPSAESRRLRLFRRCRLVGIRGPEPLG